MKTGLEIHRQRRQVKEMGKRQEAIIIAVFFLALFGKFIYLPFDEYFGTSEIWGYYFNKIKVSPGAWVDYLSTWICFALIAFAHCFIVPKFRQTYFVIGILFTLMAIEYPLTYNDPWSKYYFVPLSAGLYVGVVLIMWFFNTLRK